MEEAGVKLIAQGANVYIGDLKSAENATNGFVDATEKGGGRINAAGQVMVGALRQVGAIAVEAFGQALKATAAFVGDSIGLAGDFDQGMREFQSVAGQDLDTSGLEEFHDLFLDLGKELPVSTSEVQQAAIEMVKGGIDPAIVAAGGLRQNIQFAAAAMKGDLAGAAEISAKILGGWTSASATAAEKADFLTHSTDLLTKAANASSVDVKELALGIFNAQGIAKTAGVPFDDLTTTLALLAPRFASSSEAGNSLKNMIARLQPQTANQAGAMKALGLFTEETGSVFYDAQGNFVGFEKAAGLLQNSLKGLTKEQQASLLQTIFGNDAMGSAAALADGGAAGYAAMAEQMEKANGVAATAALVQGSFNTKLDNAKGSLETLQLTIGEKLLPILGDLLDNYITPGINTVTEWTDGILSADDPLLALVGSIDSVLPGFREFVSFLEDLTGALMDGDWASAFDVIVKGLSDLGETIGPPLIEALSSAVDTAWAWIQDQAPKWLDQLMVWGEALIEWIEPYIPPMLDALGDLVGEAWDWVKGEAPKWGNELLAWGNELVEWIEPMIPPAIAELGKLGSELLDWIGDQAAPLLKGFNDWAVSFVAWIPGATVKFLAEWPKMFDEFLDWIGDQAGPLLAELGTWALQFVEWIVPMIPGFLLTLAGVAAAILVFVAETAVVLGAKLLVWADAMVGWIGTEVLPKLPGILLGFWNTMNDLLTDIGNKIGLSMREAGGKLVAGIKTGVSNAWNSFIAWLVDLAGDALDAVFEAWGITSPAKEWMPVGSFAVQGIMAGFDQMWPALTKLVDKLGDDLIKQAADLGRSVQGAIAASFGATASIDRQIADNLDRFEDVPDQYRQFTEGALKDAEHAARQFLDPTEGAQFFAMRSKQILEFADLQQQLADAETSAEKERIQAKMNLINAAQTAEISSFNANLGATLNGTESLMSALQGLMAAQGVDEKGKPIGLPGALENSTIAAFDSWIRQLTNYAPNPYRNPMMSGSTTYNQQRQYTMPIYTNNTPEAMQQSMALMGSMI